MQKAILAKRQLDAERAVNTAVQALSEQVAVAVPSFLENPTGRDAEIKHLFWMEALADFLGSVAERAGVLEQTEGYLSETEILAMPGLTKTSQEAIRTYFAALAEATTLVNDEEE